MKKIISAIFLLILIPSFAFAFTFERYLTTGSTGSDVTALQEFLAKQGDFTGQPTGYFGPMTAQALAAFQRSQNLTPIGYIDAQTRATLNLMAGDISVTAPATPATTQTSATGATNAVQAAGAGGTSGSFTRALGIGSSGPDVTSLQQILAQQGFFSVTPTGYFGPATAASVSAFQSAHGLDSTGFVGPLTRALLSVLGTTNTNGQSSLPSIAAPATPTPAGAGFSRMLSVGSSGSDVSALQQLLKNEGYFSGDVTGFFGTITSAAVAQFQAANNIESVGSVGPKTLALLNQFLSNVSSGKVAIPSESGGADSGHGFSGGGGGGGGGGGYSPIPSSTGGGGASPGGGGSNSGSNTGGSSSNGGAGSSGGGGSSSSGAGSSTGGGSSGSGSTQADTTPPVVTATSPGNTLAAGTTQTTLTVTTNENATCNYSTAASFVFASGTSLSGAGSLTHTASLTGLTNGTSYTYYVKCSDTSGNISGNTVVAFSVAAPVVSASGWVNVAFAKQTSGFTASFDATPAQNKEDEVIGLSAASAGAYTDLAAILRFNDTGTIDVRNGDGYASGASMSYAAGKTYHIREVINISAHTYSVYVTPPGSSEVLLASNYGFRTEQASVSSLANYAKFGSNPGNDATITNFSIGTTQSTPAPTVSLVASPTSVTSGSTAKLTYSSTNATSCTGSNFSPSGTSGSTNVSPTQTTTYAISCAGAGGTASASATVTVSAAPDTTAPSTPSGLTATAVSSSAINLSWSASTDNVGVTGYNVYRGGTKIGTSATNSFSDSGLTASTAYGYAVSAFDAAGNTSAQSPSASATTQAAVVSGGGGTYDDTTHWPSASNRPVYNPATKVLTWTGPANGGPSTNADVQQSKTLVVSAPITTSHDGQIIDGVAILNDGGGYAIGIDVKNNNVTIRHCYVKGNPSNLANIYIEPGVTGTVIEDCELDGAGNVNSSGTFNVMGDPMTNATIRRNNMHDAEQMVSRTMQNILIEDNYMHDVQGQDADMVEIYVDQANSFGITIRHNTFWQTVASPGFNSAINMSNWVSPHSISGVTIDNNRFVVPDFPHVFCDDNRQGTGTVTYSATNNGFINTIKLVQTGDNNGVSPNSGNYVLTDTSDTTTTGAPFNGTGKI